MVKREKSYVEKRWKAIEEELKANHSVSVELLSVKFGVSKMTIRRDLTYLESRKIINRTHGGAVLIFDEKEELKMYREKIAKFAANFIEAGDTFFINTSSNAIQILNHIKDKRVTVITNNGKAIYQTRDKRIDVILTGGELRRQKDSMVGDFALKNLNPIYAKKAFMGCSGISAEGGITTEFFSEVNINEMMIKHATKEVYVLADHTKIGKNSSFVSADIEKINYLITDEKADSKAIDAIKKKGVKVYQVKINE